MRLVSPQVERRLPFRSLAVSVVVTISILADLLPNTKTEHAKRTAWVAVASQHVRIGSSVHLLKTECTTELTRNSIVISESVIRTDLFHVLAGHRFSNGLLAPLTC